MRAHLVKERLGLGGRQAEMCAHFLEGHALQPHACKQCRLRRPQLESPSGINGEGLSLCS